ncbi:MAG: NAD(P)-binding domain-containing protein [Desulfosarcina sp.]|nr:NAD(P)-binding domain-containing protein [Desulfosarcina sp.]
MAAQKNIKVTPYFDLAQVNASEKTIESHKGQKVGYDLLIAIPPNMGNKALIDSDISDPVGFVPTDNHTLKMENADRIYVIGDTTNVPTSKAGSVAHYMAYTLVENLIREIDGYAPLPKFDGHATCFLASGFEKAILLDFNYQVEPLPGKFPFPGMGPFSLLKESLSYILLEKGTAVFQGIIDSYPHGKKVYPSVPKGEPGTFAIPELEPDAGNAPIEAYLEKVAAGINRHAIHTSLAEEFQELRKDRNGFILKTSKNDYRAHAVVLAFGSNVPVELGIYGEAKTVARKLENPADHLNAPTLVIGGGNAAADVAATLSKAKRAVGDTTPVYWGNRMEHFKIDKDVARDLGEEILLGGHIKILQGAHPRIGEVDEEGVERLLVQTQAAEYGKGVNFQQWMSFPMKHVIACIGTQK